MDDCWLKLSAPSPERKTESKSKPSLAASPVRSSTRGRVGRGRRSGGGRVPGIPPQLNGAMLVRHTFCFTCVTGGLTNQNLTPQTIAGACGTIATQTTTAQTWASCVRINRITIWPPVGSETVPSITWALDGQLFTKDEYKFRALPKGLSIDGAITSTPPSNTLNNFWQDASNTQAVAQVSVDLGGVLHADISFVMSDNVSSTTLAITGGTIGTIYYLPLDGGGSHKLRPDGVPFI